MNTVSALLRLICGAAILVLTGISWSGNKEAIAAGGPVQIFGKTVAAGASTLTIAYGLIAVLGLGFVLLGVLSLIRGKK